MTDQSTNDLLTKALKRRAEIRLEAEALDTLIRTYQRLALIRSKTDEDENQLPLWSRGTRKAAKSEQVMKLLDAAKRLILEAKRPLDRGELAKRLEELGHEIEGGNKNKVLGTNLWRSKRFVQVEGHGYWPNDVKLPREFESGIVPNPIEKPS